MKLRKYMRKATLSMAIAGIMTLPLNCEAKGRGYGNESDRSCMPVWSNELPKQQLSPGEKTGLIKMREEEKLARDVYLTLYGKWSFNIFYNIAMSEQQHMNTVKALLEKYSLDDPAVNDSVGVFSNPEVIDLYDSLVQQGSQSLVEALKVGATIEDLDIMDLYELLGETENYEIKTVYQNLAKGSRNHLRAFTGQLSVNSISYEAQFLTADQINDIISSSQERGRVDENGVQVFGNKRGCRRQGDGRMRRS